VAVESAGVSRDYATRVLSRLVDTPSATGAELECAQVLAEELAALGLRTQVQHFAPGRGNAVGTLAGTGGGQDLLICGHLDTSYSGHEEGLDAPLPAGSRVYVELYLTAETPSMIRPTGVPVRVRVGSGVSDLAIDDFRVGSAGGKTDWRSPDYDQVKGRYDVEIGAGASEVTIRT